MGSYRCAFMLMHLVCVPRFKLCGDYMPEGGALVFEVGYHPCKKINIIRFVFQDQAMYVRTSFRSTKNMQNWRKGCVFFIYIYNIRWLARLFPTVHYALNSRDAARNKFERNMERRHDFRCKRKPKCSEKTWVGKYGSRTNFTYDSGPTGNRTRATLVKGTGTTAVPTTGHVHKF